jgi:hypothetical protein
MENDENIIKRKRGRPRIHPYIPEELRPPKKPVGRPPDPNKKGRKPYIPTGRPRGRPKKPEHEKKPKVIKKYQRIPPELHKKSGPKPRMIPFDKARSILLDEVVGSSRHYKKWYKLNRPANLPVHPDRIYKENWKGWNHFLGNNNFRIGENHHGRINYKSYEDAKQIIQKFGIKSWEEWREFCKTEYMPIDIPKRPDTFYRKDWISWKQFLGYSNIDKIMDEVSTQKYLFIAKYYSMPNNVYKVDITNITLNNIQKYAKIQQFKIIKVYKYEEHPDYKFIVERFSQPYWAGEQGDYEVSNIYALIMELDMVFIQVNLNAL